MSTAVVVSLATAHGDRPTVVLSSRFERSRRCSSGLAVDQLEAINVPLVTRGEGLEGSEIGSGFRGVFYGGTSRRMHGAIDILLPGAES